MATLHIRYKPRQHAHLDGLIAIAPWQLDAIPPPLRKQTVQIDNWTHDCRADPEARVRLRRAHGIADNAFLIGTLGRVERSKGHGILLESFARAQLPNSRLAIVGHGDDWQRLRDRAPASVVMPGFTDAPQNWLAAFDLFVSGARSEPFGLVLLEAMQAGLPIVATRSEGAQHLAPLIGTPLVPVDDVDAMAAALAAAHDTGRHRVTYPLEPFRVEAALPRIEAFYRAGLGRG